MPNTNTQSGQSGQGNSGEKFVGRFEMAMMQFVIMSKATQGGVTKENLQQVFRNGEMQMTNDHLDHCLQLLVKEQHIKQDGNKYTITDDGREDVQKVQHLVLAVPSVLNLGSGSQQREPQTKTATGGSAGTSSSAGSTGGSTGSTVGQQGNMGRSSPQGSGAGAQQQGNLTSGSVGKGGATQPASQKGNEP